MATRKARIAGLAERRAARNKYGVSSRAKRTVDGILFASQKEARRYGELKRMRDAGAVRWFIRQPSFDLVVGEAVGNTDRKPTVYRADFLIVMSDGSIVVEDVKGVKTDVYKIKKRLVEALYPIEIVET